MNEAHKSDELLGLSASSATLCLSNIFIQLMLLDYIVVEVSTGIAVNSTGPVPCCMFL